MTGGRPSMRTPEIEFHRAEGAQERGEGICRTCLAPIWNEGGTIDHRRRPEGWSDRIERGGDSLVCFKAVDYRHVPLTGREACIYDRAIARGLAAAERERDSLRASNHAAIRLIREHDDAASRLAAIEEIRGCLGAGPMDYEMFVDELDEILAGRQS